MALHGGAGVDFRLCDVSGGTAAGIWIAWKNRRKKKLLPLCPAKMCPESGHGGSINRTLADRFSHGQTGRNQGQRSYRPIGLPKWKPASSSYPTGACDSTVARTLAAIAAITKAAIARSDTEALFMLLSMTNYIAAVMPCPPVCTLHRGGGGAIGDFP